MCVSIMESILHSAFYIMHRFPECTEHVHLCIHPCRMVQLLKPGSKPYVDLTVSFDVGQGDDVPGPPIRYFFQ